MTDRTIGPFADSLAGWGNDDLLVSEKSRQLLGQSDPALLAVLDWPELRDLFRRHDAPSNLNRRHLRRTGLFSLFLMLLGLTAAIVADRIGTQVSKGLALSLGAIAGAMALYIVLRSRARSEWLIHRLWTERIRQVYFQVLVQHVDLAAAALAEQTAGCSAGAGPAMQAWQNARRDALHQLEAALRDNEAHVIDRLGADLVELKTWIDPRWEKPPAFPTTPEAERLIALMGRQRIGIQLEYVQKKTRSRLGSPISQQTWVRVLAMLFSIAAVAVGLSAIAAIIAERNELLTGITLAQAICSAIVVLAGGLDKGLAISEDADRYEWYRAALEHIDGLFRDAPDIAGRIAALRLLEKTSYAEMRRFFVAHRSGKAFG